jgi:dihydrofolate reductase
MGKLTFDISMSLDGFVAGPNQSPEHPLGEGGEALHEWGTGLRTWRERHGLEGGEDNPDAEVVGESMDAAGAVIMGRGMFGGGPGPWDEAWEGWWGDDPPFHMPVFVLTHHERKPLEKEGGTTFTFVTDGIESALEQARAAAGDKDVMIAGGGHVVQQYLRAGLVDEFQVHVAPVFLGGGVPLFDGMAAGLELVPTRVIGSDAVTHIRYRVPK